MPAVTGEPATMSEKFVSQSNKRAFRNPWVIGWTAMVVIVLGANIGMITMAVVTNPGLVNADYYEKGKQFERNVVSRQQERAAIGWDMALNLPQRLRMAEKATLSFQSADAEGRPLAGAEVKLFAYRPADKAADFSLPMTEVAPGRYEAEVGFPLKGLWDLIVHVERGGKELDLPRRIHVASP